MIKKDQEINVTPETDQEEMRLDVDTLEEVAGGANPFANVGRVKNQQIDDAIKRKI